MSPRFFFVIALAGCAHSATPTTTPATTPVVPVAAVAEPAPIEEPATPTPTPTPAASVRPDFGTAHPMFVQDMAPDGDWVFACQARADTDGEHGISVGVGHHGDLYGDELVPYLMHARALEGEYIDALLARDARGRMLAIARGPEVLVIDMDSMRSTPIPTRVAGQQGSTALVAIDEPGRRLLYARGNEGRERLVERSLEDGSEHVMDTGQGRPVLARYLGDGSFLAVAIVARDTNHNGVLDIPSQRTTRAQGVCTGEALSYSTFGFEGDAFEWAFFRTRDGARIRGRHVADGADALLVRDTSGVLHVELGSGEPSVTIPAACQAFVTGFWPEQRAILAGCADGDVSRLRIFDPSGEHDLSLSQTRADEEDEEASVGRFAVVYGDAQKLVDLATRRVVPRAYGGELGIRGPLVLETIARGVVQLRDFEHDDVTRVLPATREESYVHGTEHGRFVVVSHDAINVYDFERRAIIGTLEHEPILITDDGAALVLANPDTHTGPLRWVRPRS